MASLTRTSVSATDASVRARPLRCNVLRMVLFAATLAWFVSAVLDHPTPLVMALGILPIAWIGLEAVWHLTAEHAEEDQ